MRIIAIGTLALLVGCESSAHECTDEPGTACTWAGTGVQGINKEVRDRRDSNLNWPSDIGFSLDNQGYIVDWNNHEIRRVDADDALRTVMGNTVEAEGSPDGADYLPPQSPIGAPGT